MLVNGYPLVCPHCQGRSFQHKRIMLNTKGMTFFELDWLNKDADTFACTGCGRIEWFTGATISEGERRGRAGLSALRLLYCGGEDVLSELLGGELKSA